MATILRVVVGVPILLFGLVIVIAGLVVSFVFFPIGPLAGIPISIGGGMVAGFGLAILMSGMPGPGEEV